MREDVRSGSCGLVGRCPASQQAHLLKVFLQLFGIEISESLNDGSFHLLNRCTRAKQITICVKCANFGVGCYYKFESATIAELPVLVEADFLYSRADGLLPKREVLRLTPIRNFEWCWIDDLCPVTLSMTNGSCKQISLLNVHVHNVLLNPVLTTFPL
jgi:hypothetical protein